MRLGKLGSWVIILVWSVNFTLGHEDADDPDHKHEEIKESKVALKKAESTKDDSSKKPVCTTESGASPNLPCIFPFRFNGVTHTTCIWDMAHLTEHKPWCSTLVDEVGHHVGGQSKWGNCGPDCPIPPDTRNQTTIASWYCGGLISCIRRNGAIWSTIAPFTLTSNVVTNLIN
jgi:hypothetical protein